MPVPSGRGQGKVTRHQMSGASQNVRTTGEGPIGTAGEGQDFEPQMGKRSPDGSSPHFLPISPSRSEFPGP